MGFYIRKGFNFGPLRLNLSRSGVVACTYGTIARGRTSLKSWRTGSRRCALRDAGRRRSEERPWR